MHIFSLNMSPVLQEDRNKDDNFGVPDGVGLPVHGSLEWQKQELYNCTLKTSSFYTMAYATANWYRTTDNFRAFKGVDLVPENKELYNGGYDGGKLFKDNMKINKKSAREVTDELTMEQCLEHPSKTRPGT